MHIFFGIKCARSHLHIIFRGPSWSWSYGSSIYNSYGISSYYHWSYEFKSHSWQCILAAGVWFSLDTLIFSISKTDRHNIAEILWTVALNTISLISNHNLIHIDHNKKSTIFQFTPLTLNSILLWPEQSQTSPNRTSCRVTFPTLDEAVMTTALFVPGSVTFPCHIPWLSTVALPEWTLFT